MKNIIFAIVIIIICLLLSGVPSEKTVRILAVGDIMLGRNVAKVMKEQDIKPFDAVKEVLQEGDVVFGNLESMISEKEKPEPAYDKPYSFFCTPDTVPYLKEAHFDVLSLANNHAMDYGTDVLLTTRKILADHGIQSFGAGETISEARLPALVKAKGLTIVFLGYSNGYSINDYAMDTKPGISPIMLSDIGDDIKRWRSKADILVVSLHWGVEYQTKPKSQQKEVAHAIIDQGADIVLGHHPHVVQPVEQYKGKIIAYSLGNFLFDVKSPRRNNGIILSIEASRNGIHSYKSIYLDRIKYYFPATGVGPQH